MKRFLLTIQWTYCRRGIHERSILRSTWHWWSSQPSRDRRPRCPSTWHWWSSQPSRDRRPRCPSTSQCSSLCQFHRRPVLRSEFFVDFFHFAITIITQADGSHGLGFLPLFVCVYVFLQDISKTDAASITKLDTQSSTMRLGNPFILGSKGQRSRSHVTKIMPAWTFALLWVLASSSYDSNYELFLPQGRNTHYTSPSSGRWTRDSKV